MSQSPIPVLACLAAACATLAARADVRSSANYAVTAESLAAGGQLAASETLENLAVIAQTSQGTSLNGNYLVAAGFAAELDNPPITPTLTLTRASGQEAQTPFSLFWGAITDPDGWPIEAVVLSPVTANGGSVTLIGGSFLSAVYSPPTGDDSPDSFTYTATDAAAERSTGVVNVVVQPPSPPLAADTVGVLPVGGTTLLIQFAGPPGANTTIQWTDVLGNPWHALATTPAGASGIFQTTDNATGTFRFYRAVSQ